MIEGETTPKNDPRSPTPGPAVIDLNELPSCRMKSTNINSGAQSSAGVRQSAANCGRELNSRANWFSEILESHKCAVLGVFSIAYFILTFYRASRKLFWFDELFTVYLSRLPDLKSVWRALMNGVDFNPPLFYLLTRFAEHIPGEGHIAARLPAILGFWVFCLCLFRFVSLRLSIPSACVSMLFPLVTGAYWYAYEARAHGIVLGFCGIAIISWQAAADRTARRGWSLFALGGSLSCALLTHSYAFLIFAPIVLGELSRTTSRKRPDWPIWTTIAVSSLGSLASIPFVHQVVSEVRSQSLFPAKLFRIIILYRDLLTPAAGVLAGWVILTCLVREKTEDPKHEPGLRGHEILALWAFVAIPFFEYAAAKLTGAPFLSRYGISTVAGFAGLLGVAVGKRPVVAIGTLMLLVGQIGFAFFGFASGSVLREPSSGYPISTRIREFSERYEWMAEDKTLPIVLIDDLDFMTTSYYAPPSVAPQLVYFVWPRSGVMGEGFARLKACCKSEPAVLGLSEFLASHDAFLVYGGPSRAYAYRLQYFVNTGATLETKRETHDHFLVLVTYPKRTAKPASR
jgi:Dolichyl-phosphate-mannose-protein mannosyltransferase